MPAHDVRCVHLPYCIKRQTDGSYIVLNRDYKPLGFKSTSHVRYEDYPIAVRIPGLRANTAAKISWKGSTDLSEIFLYNDGCIPTESAVHMEAYTKRLAHFAKLKVRRVPMS